MCTLFYFDYYHLIIESILIYSIIPNFYFLKDGKLLFINLLFKVFKSKKKIILI